MRACELLEHIVAVLADTIFWMILTSRFEASIYTAILQINWFALVDQM